MPHSIDKIIWNNWLKIDMAQVYQNVVLNYRFCHTSIGWNLIECSADVFSSMSLTWTWASVHTNLLYQVCRLPKMSLSKQRRSSRISAKKPCQPKSSTKPNTTKTDTSKLKEIEYVYVLQPKTDHQKNVPLTNFGWVGPNIVENTSLNNNYFIRKNGTDNIQILHRLRIRPLTPTKPIPDVPTMSQE